MPALPQSNQHNGMPAIDRYYAIPIVFLGLKRVKKYLHHLKITRKKDRGLYQK
jgi:hypothetical protein